MALDTRTAIVTGIARPRGLGRAILRSLLRAQYKVVGIDRIKPASLDEELAQSSSCLFLQADLSQEDQIHAVAAEACSWLKNRVNVLVNNAGIAQPYMSGDGAERRKQWHSYIDTNLTAAFLLTEALIPHMPPGDTSIIHISSTRAHQSEANTEGYSAAKAGLIGLTQSQATTLAKKARVNVVLPGYIYTEEEDASTGLSQEDHDWHLTGRVGEPEDIAEMCLFLADNKRSKYITGQQFVVDGGVTKKMIYPE